MNKIKTVTFTNADAVMTQWTLMVNEEAIPTLLMIYDGFYSGDAYTMSVDGELVPTLNGEILS